MYDDFIKRTENLSNVKLYILELAYRNQDFHIVP